ncbi:hypothetical protein M422DRAFT_256193 [Sphaerobolus stellatus SS14]|uniref:Uncharacterized protein n=1 Tax=Sphaerobolus stellatus (strain SS14) TaxID=990650 RepID=A0A0C9V133_SPHS4|nr:hypothetical protein M422DRAFT_256193 [Sphaerobolus stellatus SS14]
MATQQISIDISFKRVHKWQEFEIKAWFPSYNRSVIVSWAFITSQSAAAHLLLFKCIFQVAEVDTGKPFRIRHIHGDGLDSVTADEHWGQAVGFGMFCQELSKGMMGYCAYEQTKAIHNLSAYDHLKRLYRYCFSHYTHHVGELRGYVEGEVLTAMMSLTSVDALPVHVYEKILHIIHNSGKKGKDWLKDKEAGEGWPMAAIYWGKSFMPLSVWKAAPSTSNGNEQAHRNINRDGIKLSILAGTMKGYHLDSRAMSMLEVEELLGIDTNDPAATHFRRSRRALHRSIAVQKRNNLTNDKELGKSYQQLEKLQQEASKLFQKLKRGFEGGSGIEHASKRLKNIQSKYSEEFAALKSLQDKSTSRVPMPALAAPHHLIQPLPQASASNSSVHLSASSQPSYQYNGSMYRVQSSHPAPGSPYSEYAVTAPSVYHSHYTYSTYIPPGPGPGPTPPPPPSPPVVHSFSTPAPPYIRGLPHPSVNYTSYPGYYPPYSNNRSSILRPRLETSTGFSTAVPPLRVPPARKQSSQVGEDTEHLVQQPLVPPVLEQMSPQTAQPVDTTIEHTADSGNTTIRPECPPEGIKITPWRIINTFVVLGFGITKTVSTYGGKDATANWSDLTVGLIWATIAYWVSLAETESKTAWQWLLQKPVTVPNTLIKFILLIGVIVAYSIFITMFTIVCQRVVLKIPDIDEEFFNNHLYISILLVWLTANGGIIISLGLIYVAFLTRHKLRKFFRNFYDLALEYLAFLSGIYQHDDWVLLDASKWGDQSKVKLGFISMTTLGLFLLFMLYFMGDTDPFIFMTGAWAASVAIALLMACILQPFFRLFKLAMERMSVKKFAKLFVTKSLQLVREDVHAGVRETRGPDTVFAVDCEAVPEIQHGPHR